MTTGTLACLATRLGTTPNRILVTTPSLEAPMKTASYFLRAASRRMPAVAAVSASVKAPRWNQERPAGREV
jgi:hypothetical protein